MPSPKIADYWANVGLTGVMSRALFRALQCLFAVVVAILYGLDLQKATSKHLEADSRWIYAEFVAGVSMTICIIHLFFTATSCGWTILDGMVSVLWLAQFGVFASQLLSDNTPLYDAKFYASESRMKAAVWINLISMLLWFATTVLGTMRCCARRRKAKMLARGETVNMERLESQQ
ncbi:MARVEL domain-containing protein [Fusarium sp. Ph1]|nr:MARVEL domain-containing protein [Fusarium sp. Ph1]